MKFGKESPNQMPEAENASAYYRTAEEIKSRLADMDAILRHETLAGQMISESEIRAFIDEQDGKIDKLDSDIREMMTGWSSTHKFEETPDTLTMVYREINDLNYQWRGVKHDLLTSLDEIKTSDKEIEKNLPISETEKLNRRKELDEELNNIAGTILSEDLSIPLVSLEFEKWCLGWLKNPAIQFSYSGIERFNDENMAAMAGLDSEDSWKIRQRHLVEQESILLSLSGLNTEKAWGIRRTFYTQDVIHRRRLLLRSLIGLDNEESWKLREEFVRRFEASEVLRSMSGLDSDKAWELREKISGKVEDWNAGKTPLDLGELLRSLKGCSSERAWRVRNFAANNKFEDWNYARGIKLALKESLEGLDDENAWRLRDSLDENSTLESLAGVDSGQAWEIRDSVFNKFMKTGDDDGFILLNSLRGIESARALEMKEKIIRLYKKRKKNVHPLYVTGGVTSVSLNKARLDREKIVA